MKTLPLAALACALFASVGPAWGQTSVLDNVVRETFQYQVDPIGRLDVVSLPPLMVASDHDALWYYQLGQAMGGEQSLPTVSVGTGPGRFADRIDDTFVGSLIGTVDDIRRRHGLIDLDLLGVATTVRIDSGVVWRLGPHAVCGFESIHRGLAFYESYEFRDAHDLGRYCARFMQWPIVRANGLLSRISGF